VLYELSAEVSFGNEGAEGLSAGLIVLVWNSAAFLMLFVAPLLQGAATVNALTTATFVLAVIVAAGGVTESYGRAKAERQDAS